MSQQKQRGFLLVVKIINIFIAYGQQEVLKAKEGKGIGKELLEYAINDSKEKDKSGYKYLSIMCWFSICIFCASWK